MYRGWRGGGVLPLGSGHCVPRQPRNSQFHLIPGNSGILAYLLDALIDNGDAKKWLTWDVDILHHWELLVPPDKLPDGQSITSITFRFLALGFKDSSLWTVVAHTSFNAKMEMVMYWGLLMTYDLHMTVPYHHRNVLNKPKHCSTTQFDVTWCKLFQSSCSRRHRDYNRICICMSYMVYVTCGFCHINTPLTSRALMRSLHFLC